MWWPMTYPKSNNFKSYFPRFIRIKLFSTVVEECSYAAPQLHCLESAQWDEARSHRLQAKRKSFIFVLIYSFVYIVFFVYNGYDSMQP
jgi:hypothetical protein